MNRLRWQPYLDAHGFIAYPIGEDRKHAFACIWPESGMHAGQWRWLVRVGYPKPERDSLSDAPRRGGLAATKQDAADAATAAWPEVVAEGRERGLL